MIYAETKPRSCGAVAVFSENVITQLLSDFTLSFIAIIYRNKMTFVLQKPTCFEQTLLEFAQYNGCILHPIPLLKTSTKFLTLQNLAIKFEFVV